MITLPSYRGRVQFSLRSLLVFTAVVAAYFSMGCSVGFIEASGTLIASLLMMAAWRWRRRGAWGVVRLLLGIAAVAVLWMVAVDWSWFVERCDDCWLDRDILQIRVYRVPVAETTREYGVLHLVARDLGVPCSHNHVVRWHKYRFWGLIYPAWPCISGTLRLSGEDWYDDAITEIVRAKAKESPGLAEEFRRRVLVDHDRQYLFAFLAELRKSRMKETSHPSKPASN